MKSEDYDILKNQILALVANIISWLCSFIWPVSSVVDYKKDSCVVIEGPGGLEKLRVMEFSKAPITATIGYNIPNPAKNQFVTFSSASDIPDGMVIVAVSHFSINYADVCIRWGLYESALRYIGWPIVPGFDFSGEVVHCGKNSGFSKGDVVFGFSLFGAYSAQVMVPSSQIRKSPKSITRAQIAGVPAVSATALHCVNLAGGWPSKIMSKNKAVLIHSAGGGVGSMLIQICKIVGYSPIVAVVGSTHKKEYCASLGADFVIDKSQGNLWEEAEFISRTGYSAIFDANGVETLEDSYQHLCRTGKLIVYGFHTNLPKASDLLSPMSWCTMLYRLVSMPKFDVMKMVLDSKCVAGFNLSFFADEHELIEKYMEQLLQWLESGALKPAAVTEFPVTDIRKAHEMIQSGKSIGKIVVKMSDKVDKKNI